MKASEILRKLADVIDTQQSDSKQTPNRAVLTPAEPESGEGEHINTQSMVAPLQQKLELLKKSVGLDNAFDNGDIQLDGEPCDSTTDELAVIKQNAGIRPVVVQIASDDEPLDM
jgi:hypothetical protein